MQKLIVFICLLPLVLFAQEKSAESKFGWKRKGQFDATFSKVTLTNWAAGGRNTFALNINGVYNINYKSENIAWQNTIKGAYGLLREDYGEYFKSDDRLEFNSKFGRNISEDILLSATYNVRTQFRPTMDDEVLDSIVSRFSSPAFHVFALGFDYNPNDTITVVLAPASGKMTVVNDEELSELGVFGLEPGEKYRLELGGYVKISYTQEIFKDFQVSSDLELFSNYLENPQNVDINWENRITYRLNKVFSLSLNNQLIYDDDIKIDYTEEGKEKSGPKLQYREVIGLSLGITF